MEEKCIAPISMNKDNYHGVQICDLHRKYTIHLNMIPMKNINYRKSLMIVKNQIYQKSNTLIYRHMHRKGPGEALLIDPILKIGSRRGTSS